MPKVRMTVRETLTHVVERDIDDERYKLLSADGSVQQREIASEEIEIVKPE